MMLDRQSAIGYMNDLGSRRTPFFFFTDFLGSKTWIKPLAQINDAEVQFEINETPTGGAPGKAFSFQKYPPSKEQFNEAFNKVVEAINYGNSYLVNLTFQTPIDTDLTLPEIYERSRAKYKVLFPDQFVVFSPETFVQIEEGYIYSYPMKGTIDASVHKAEEAILNDPKEIAEHVTIVDLIRNDLSQIANEVKVTKFRFISEVRTHEKKLLQVSSEISGKLPNNHLNELGTLLYQLLPAGSISGAPKRETLNIIRQAETHDRDFYTGICGRFDGTTLDTGVMIRFIEQRDGQLYYKSGGGITSFSRANSEYQEIIDKVYLPID